MRIDPCPHPSPFDATVDSKMRAALLTLRKSAGSGGVTPSVVPPPSLQPVRSPIDATALRKVVSDTVASIAPEFDAQRIRPEHPLREQIDLDSMDWLNVLAGLQDKLGVHIPVRDHDRLTSLDSIAAYIASRLAQQPAQAPRPGADPLAALPRTLQLLDGTTVTLRTLHADDAPLEADFVRGLSVESRYNRFMVSMHELPPATVKSLTDVDAVHHVALAATMRRDGREVLIGAARYVVDAAGTDCEFAVAVDDAWHGSGLAGILMHTLMDVARTRGLRRMEGTVLASNAKMLKFMRQLGFSLRADPDDRHEVRAARTL
jgi:acetyltransferase